MRKDDSGARVFVDRMSERGRHGSSCLVQHVHIGYRCTQ